jgi:hypothetical protein
MFKTTASTIPNSAKAKGALAREGAPVPKGALEGEQARACEGRRDEFPTSQFRGGDLALSCYCCFDVLTIRVLL